MLRRANMTRCRRGVWPPRAALQQQAPLSTTSSSSPLSAHRQRASGVINLTPYVSPLLLRLHPDRLQRHSVALARDNEEALKELNQFLEIASLACNNDGFRARKQILSLAESHHGEAGAPIRLPLRFHITSASTAVHIEKGEDEESDANASALPFTLVKHTIEVPAVLVRRTLAHGTRAASKNLSDAAATPFAREWQRTTKRILKDLFHVAKIPLYAANEGPVTCDGTEDLDEDRLPKEQGIPTQLALWLEEEDSVEQQRERGVATHNADVHRMHREFDAMFRKMLAQEKNIVHPVTTGLEDGPTTQHVILTRLITRRVFLERSVVGYENQRRVFFWLANFLLINFMELRLHALVWNKVMLMVTADESVETPQVLWEEARPEEGMAILIPAEMDVYALVDLLYEHVEELELALDHGAQKRQQQRERKKRSTTTTAQKKKKKPHFYSAELAAIFRKT